MRIPKAVVDYFQSNDYDYWESLQREKDFILKESGITIDKNEIHTTGIIRKFLESEIKRSKLFKNELIAEKARYFIPKNRTELEKSLKDDSEISMILTIEGAHSLGTDRASVAEVSKRVKYLKSEWEVPVFFITFAHHFNNRLCGHAHSIPDKGKILLNQSSNMNAGFHENGQRIVRELLSLNKNLERDPEFGYRILIDVKHMSAQSRKDYYEEIVIPCLTNGDRIPVIASHCGYSGLETLQEHIDNYNFEKDDYTDKKTKKFNAWNINVCDQDIEIILKTGGIFGLSFDQRILGITKKEKNKPRNGIQLLWENIEGIAKGVYSNPNLTEAQKLNIWKSMTIGTDFEGLIDPTDFYPTALEFDIFSNNLIFEIEQARKDPEAIHLSQLKSREDTEQLVDDFCFNNAEAFALENFPK
jgi:microsomal dipeptidase-like Zn-dependent dipeptidase